MNTRLAVTLSLIAFALLVVIGWAGWNWWAPLLTYRMQRNNQAMRGIMNDYLDGKRDLEPAAQAVARLWREKLILRDRLARSEPPSGGGSLTAVQLPPPPPGVRSDDPRLTRLGERAIALTVGPEAWQRFQAIQHRTRGDP